MDVLVRVGNAIYPLVEGQPLRVSVGQKITVLYSFQYKVGQRVEYPVWASLYTKTPLIGTVNREEKAQYKGTVILEAATTLKPFSGEATITVGSVKSGVYGLIVELPGVKEAEAKIDDCIEVAAAPNIIEQILPIMVMVMMMGMIMPMMEEEE